MSDQEWSKEAIFDTPLARRQVEEPIKIEQPPAVETAHAPPVPEQAELRAALENPALAEALWRNNGESAEAPPDDAQAVAQLGMALYLLQTLHGQHTPGLSQPPRDERKPRPEDDERTP